MKHHRWCILTASLCQQCPMRKHVRSCSTNSLRSRRQPWFAEMSTCNLFFCSLQFSIKYCIIVIQFDVLDCLCVGSVPSHPPLSLQVSKGCPVWGLPKPKKRPVCQLSGACQTQMRGRYNRTENTWQLSSAFMSFKRPDTCRLSESVPVEMQGKMSLGELE